MSLESLITGIASRLPAPGARDPIVALCYHAIAPTGGDRWTVTPAAFERHLARIAGSGARVLTAGELPGARGPAVLLTFDDNLPSHDAAAAPALRAAGLRATFFVNPGELGAPGALDRAGVDRLLGQGMTVGAHYDRHVLAAGESLEAFAHGVDRCAAFLESIGMPLTWAYPGGHRGSFRAHHERILRQRGFQVRFSTLEGRIHADRLDRPQGRYVMRRDTTDRYLAAALRGGLGLIRLAKRARGLTGAEWRGAT